MTDPAQPRTIQQLPRVTERREELAGRLAGRRPAVFLDYDGTLSEIVDDPEQAVLDEDTRRVVERLAARCTTAVVSGRDTADVRRRVAVDGVVYAGSHGFDITAADGTSIDDSRGQPFLPALDSAERALREALAGVGGAIVERKRFTIAVHYRQVADEDLPTVERAVDDALAGRPQLRRAGGKKVYELRPDVDWDKGHAVLALLDALDVDRGATGDEVVAIYVGDDLTDEDAFRAIAGRGVGVVVRGDDRPTAADYSLADPTEVRAFLEELLTIVAAASEQ